MKDIEISEIKKSTDDFYFISPNSIKAQDTEEIEDKESETDPYSEELRKEIIDRYLFVNSPIMNQINSLRKTELQKIVNTEEFKKFKESLPKDQHITIDGYIIYRQSIKTVKPGLPGFEDEVFYEYKYDNPPEDITILFGDTEYCKKFRELQSQLLSWEDYCIKYYGSPFYLTSDWKESHSYLFEK